MKKIFLFLAVVFPFICFSQIKVEIPQEFVRVNDGTGGMSNIKYEGSPYLYDSYVPGKIVVSKDQSFQVMIRYNAYSDVFEMLDDKNRNSALNKMNDVKVIMAGREYQIYSYFDDGMVNEGYFENLSVDGDIKFFRRDAKKFVDLVKAESGYTKDKPAKFVLESPKYYVQTNGNPLEEIRLKKKDILAAFNAHKNEVNTFVKTQKLNLKKQEDIIKLFNYYSTL